MGLNLLQKQPEAVVPQLPEGDIEIVLAGHILIDIIKPTIADDACGVLFQHVETVEDITRVDVAKTLTEGIAQIAFREIILQPRRHLIYIIEAGIDIQATQSLQVALNLGQAELLGIETQVLDTLEISHEGVGAPVDAMAVDPEEIAPTGIIAARAIVSHEAVAVGGNQVIELLTYAP